MRIGIDIGGTHTDGVLIDGTRLIAAAKAPTLADDLLASITQVLESILVGQDPRRVHTFNLSTTLSTNAIVTGSIEPVGVLVVGGPGIDPEHYRIGDHYHLIPGSLDHLGNETLTLDTARLDQAIDACMAAGVRSFAVAGKFSPRNPAHENTITEKLADRAEFVSTGHLVSGQLNFGRRIHTSYYNSAVWRTFRTFSAALDRSLKGFDLQAEVNILKADGGTMPLARALDTPVQSIFSGPAASVMGILATVPAETDALMLDIGGTTTDIALFADGQPLLEREGIAIEGRPSLVRAVYVESIGIGGDSQITVAQGTVRTGPQRRGPCLAAGGTTPALMDAFNLLGLVEYGDTGASRRGMEGLAVTHGLDSRKLAQAAVDAAVEAVATRIDSLVTRVNAKPVYTIHEILQDRKIEPRQVMVIGGPAEVFQHLLAERLGLPVVVPPLAGVVNAVGAALTRTTSHLALTADTSRNRVAVPMLGVYRTIKRGYKLDDAIEEARTLLVADLKRAGVTIPAEEIQITQADAFNMVEGGYTAGTNIRVVAQVQPAVIARLDADTSMVRLTGPA
ncbi:MAG: hydantoinase/oxoprolinase family protein [Desulfobulbus sp.]|jgi:N-methylhydantoinase A/oxoprolinase/acetone carboxylase beta subunit|nr:hydantoinase/oxoprolinase family protein [Desulfobulbus sp.]